ncbi:hydrogenase expression/synthesis HypA [Solidesulfovibrio carbinoliphilus subsp. oakridgensis]|uniref:Hydrogenase maturation factor HypA n=1 Tax=Solidesulfovibrio carbinoliphilus subsp. oakridgensis TaxID=694327 RepID=G7QDN6_9BACT|nr:hydrogenase maturation nickel metallochaperone HypA [Solidesulfovibrio carbinoliphilus]EHJ46542.1 hydrogenase expression/synthesis HypA [Solidesulfovibrio carbinoliphilus subsp. oakridgensis]
MHELAIVQSLLAIIEEEMAKQENKRLLTVKVKHGRLSAVVPEALEMGFETMTMDTAIAGAKLVLEETPVVLRCRACGREFTPEVPSAAFAPCPACGEELGHTVLSGRELYIEYLELE